MSWKKYESHKIVQAMPIVAVVGSYNGHNMVYVMWDGVLSQVFPSVPEMANKAHVGDYYVAYAGDEGYTSISPKKAFDEGYAEVKE